MSLFLAHWLAAIGAFQSSLLFQLLDGVPSQVLINCLYILYWNNNEDRNAPIAANQCATNGDT